MITLGATKICYTCTKCGTNGRIKVEPFYVHDSVNARDITYYTCTKCHTKYYYDHSMEDFAELDATFLDTLKIHPNAEGEVL